MYSDFKLQEIYCVCFDEGEKKGGVGRHTDRAKQTADSTVSSNPKPQHPSKHCASTVMPTDRAKQTADSTEQRAQHPASTARQQCAPAFATAQFHRECDCCWSAAMTGLMTARPLVESHWDGFGDRTLQNAQPSPCT